MKRHVAALDGLRGVAVAAVVVYHLRPEWVPAGFLGVDLFFVLSGYLITSLLLEEYEAADRIDLMAFAVRRLRRLLPAVMVVVLAVTVYVARNGDLGEIERVRRHAIATLAYVANWIFIADGDSYFGDVVGPSLLRHVWSLAIEEQFYLVWPATAWLALRIGGRRMVAWVALGGAVASLGWMAVLHTGGDPSRVYFGTDTRIFEPLIGAFAAVMLPLRDAKPVALVRLAPVAAAVWVATVFLVEDTWGGFYEGGAVVIAAVAALLVVATSAPGAMATILSWRPLVALGTISYAVYLWHWPILIVLRNDGHTGLGLDLAVVAVTLILSTLSLWLIERPVRRMTRQRLPAMAVAIAAIVACVGVVAAVTTTELPADAVTAEEALAALDPPPPSSPSDNPDVPDRPLTVVLIGDSSAWTLGGGLVSWGLDHGPYDSPFDPHDIVLLNLARKGYRLAPGATIVLGDVRPRPEVDLEDEAWWRKTIAEVQPDLVVAMFGLSDIQSREIDGTLVEFGTPEFREHLDAAASALLGDLADDAPVVILTSPPLIGANMPQPEMAAFLEAHGATRMSEINELLTEVAAADPGLAVIDFARLLCPGGEGPDLDDGCLLAAGAPARHDGVHFTEAGAQLAADLLTPELLALTDGELTSTP